MKNKDVFEQLAVDMPEEERKSMLKELKDDLKKHRVVNEKDTDKALKKEKESKFLEKEYHNTGFIEKLQLFVRKLITGKSVYILMKDKHLKNLGKEIEHNYPGFVDIKESKIREPYCKEINILKNSLFDLAEIVKVIEIKGKAEFYQFVAATEMSELEKTLEKNTDPDFIYRTGQITEKDKIKNEIMRQYHEIVESIDSVEKDKVYEIIRGFFLIHQLVVFRFDHMIKKFEYEVNGNKYSPFGSCRKYIRELYDILSSLTDSSVSFGPVLKYMVEYYYEYGDVSHTVSREDYITKMISKVSADFNSINGFIKNAPLKSFIRYLYKDINYEAVPLSGGEEWFSVYKNYLKEKIDKRYDLFLNDQKKNNILMKLRYFIDTIPDESKLKFSIEIHERTYELKYANIFYYLKEMKNTFFKMKIDRIVSKILLDGVFYKDANKKELYDSYNTLNSIDDKFIKFMNKIDPDGEESKNIRKYNFEEKSIKQQKKKTERFIAEINNYLFENYICFYESFTSISNILYGIIHGNVGGTYDTLSNLSDICVEKTFMSITSINSININMKEILLMFKDLNELYNIKND